MAHVTAETVAYVARLANLSLSPEETLTFARQLDEILAHAESIQALDTTQVEAMSHAGAGGDFREDEPHASLARDKALQAAPDPAEGLFRVPRVIG